MKTVQSKNEKGLTRNIKNKQHKMEMYEYIENVSEAKKYFQREELEIGISKKKIELDDAIRTDDPNINKLKSEYKKLLGKRKMLSENIRIMK